MAWTRTSFLHFEDLDLCRRVRDVGWKVVFVPDISIFHFQGGSSEHLSHRVSWEKHRSMRRYQRKHHGRISLAPRVGIFDGVGPFPTAKNEVDVYAPNQNRGGATVVAGGVGRIVQYDCFDWRRGG